MLARQMTEGRLEAGCDEAGRGCLAGPVVAACVVLPPDFDNPVLNDSKQLTAHQREMLRPEIEWQAWAWAVAIVSPGEVDRLNILHASTHAMCLAAEAVTAGKGKKAKGKYEVFCGGARLGKTKPEHLLIDGNRFYNETDLTYTCVVKGDATYMNIAAASILAKTHRDTLMEQLDTQYPAYGWGQNKGYPTRDHYDAIEAHGITPLHRRSFALYRQKSLFE